METLKISSATREVIISYEHPTVLIGERINPAGKKRLAASLQAGDLELVRQEALAQMKAGADAIDVNISAFNVDEIAILPRAVRAVMEMVDIPLCIDSAKPEALEAALKIYKGKALINSVSGDEKSLVRILPLVKEYGAAIIGLTQDEQGIPADAEGRVAIAHKIIKRAEAIGIPRQDIIVDCLAFAVGANPKAGIVTLEAIRRIKAELGVNQTLGASNISFGLPDRNLLNAAFLAIAISAGVTCPIVDVAKVRQVVLATDLILGRDKRARRFMESYRERQKG